VALPTPRPVLEFPTAVPADVWPGEVPSSGLPLSFEKDDVAPNEDASVVAPVVALGEMVPGARLDEEPAAPEVVVFVVLVVLVVLVGAVSAVAPGVVASVLLPSGATVTLLGGATIAEGDVAAGAVVVVVVLVAVADVAAIRGDKGVKRAASARATDAVRDFGRGGRMAELLSDRCPVRSDAMQCVCQRP